MGSFPLRRLSLHFSVDRPVELGGLRQPGTPGRGARQEDRIDLLKGLSQITQVWYAEFDRTGDTDTRREHTRKASSKRRSDKRAKDEKVCGVVPNQEDVGLLLVV